MRLLPRNASLEEAVVLVVQGRLAVLDSLEIPGPMHPLRLVRLLAATYAPTDLELVTG